MESAAPLSGVVVAERGGRLASAVAATLLGELGATVLRLEDDAGRPRSDPPAWHAHPLALEGKQRFCADGKAKERGLGRAVRGRAGCAGVRSRLRDRRERRAADGNRDGVRRQRSRHRSVRARRAGPLRRHGDDGSGAGRAVRGACAAAGVAGRPQHRDVGARGAARWHARCPRPRALRQRAGARRHVSSASARQSGAPFSERIAAHAVRAMEFLPHVRRLGDDLHRVRRPMGKVRGRDRPRRPGRKERARDIAAAPRGDRGRRCRGNPLDAGAARGGSRARAARRRPSGLRRLRARAGRRGRGAHGRHGRRRRVHGAGVGRVAFAHAAAACGAHRRAEARQRGSTVRARRSARAAVR